LEEEEALSREAGLLRSCPDQDLPVDGPSTLPTMMESSAGLLQERRISSANLTTHLRIIASKDHWKELGVSNVHALALSGYQW
jgi:hypothetical protein